MLSSDYRELGTYLQEISSIPRWDSVNREENALKVKTTRVEFTEFAMGSEYAQHPDKISTPEDILAAYERASLELTSYQLALEAEHSYSMRKVIKTGVDGLEKKFGKDIQTRTDEMRRIRNDYIDARDELIKSHLKLVISVAKKYSGYGVSLSDLVSEGNVALVKAADIYDPNIFPGRTCKFSTLAASMIRNQILRYLPENIKPVRIPGQVGKLLSLFRRVRDLLYTQNGREPSDKEISKRMKITKGAAKNLREVATPDIYLDGEWKTGRPTQDLAEEKEVDGSETESEHEEQSTMDKETLGALVKSLDYREREVIISRYGIMGRSPKTLEHLGKRFGLTREGIRQIERNALSRLNYRARMELRTVRSSFN